MTTTETTARSAMKLALEALEEINKLSIGANAVCLPAEIDTAMDALREALAEQPAQQEPVAWLHVMDNTEGLKANGTGIVLITQKRKHPFGKPGVDFSKSYPVTSTPLYTTPPQRTWVGLTDEEIDQGLLRSDYAFKTAEAWRAGVVFAMTKLKEKNCG